MAKVILELRVSRENQKGIEVFYSIFVFLHSIGEKKNFHFFKKKEEDSHFSWEVVLYENTLSFFFVCNEEYSTFVKNQFYAQYGNDIEIYVVEKDYMEYLGNTFFVGEVGLKEHFLFPLRMIPVSELETHHPYCAIFGAFSKAKKDHIHILQFIFTPIEQEKIQKEYQEKKYILVARYPKLLKKFFFSSYWTIFKIIGFPFVLFARIIRFLVGKTQETESQIHESLQKDEYFPRIEEKVEDKCYRLCFRIIVKNDDTYQARRSIEEIFSTFSVFHDPKGNALFLRSIKHDMHACNAVRFRRCKNGCIVSSKELAQFVHLPTKHISFSHIKWITTRHYQAPIHLPVVKGESDTTMLTPIGKTFLVDREYVFGMKHVDRRKHMYIIGKTGMGKSTLLENMIIDDIQKRKGVAVIDPHGDLADAIIGNIPKSRTNHSIIFDISDSEYPISFNIFENVDPVHRPFVASGLIAIFKKIFGDSWGPRLEYVLRNIFLTLLYVPKTTLLSVPLILTSQGYRSRIVERVDDLVLKKFWKDEFEKWTTQQKLEASAPILNKIGQFLSNPLLRNILGQERNSFSIRWAMDNSKILIINLSKGKIGEDVSSLLGALLIHKFQIDAMSRADLSEENRVDFYLYVDEFQNFVTDTFATLLAEARKYRLNLILANQYIGQLTENVKMAVMGNVGTLISFQVGYFDACVLKDVFGGGIQEEDLMNLKHHTVYMKMLIDGMPSSVFSAVTLPPPRIERALFEERYRTILRVSREKFCDSREKVEKKIAEFIRQVEGYERKYQESKKRGHTL